MKNSLSTYINKFKGNLLCIGVNDEGFIKLLEKNNNINTYLINRHKTKLGLRRNKKVTMNNGKKINIKKLEKTFTYKSIDNIICSYDEISDYFKYFIDDSLNICCGNIYIYGYQDEIDIQSIINRYNKYIVEVSKSDKDNTFLIIVKTPNKKIGPIIKKGHLIINSFKNIGDFISNILVS